MNEARMVAVVGEGFGASVEAGVRSSVHAQHAVALFAGVDAAVRVVVPGAPAACGRLVLVPPDLLHAVESRGTAFGVLFDAELHEAARAVAREARGAPRILEGPARTAWRARSGRTALLSRGPTCWRASRPRRSPCSPPIARTASTARVRRAREALRDPASDRGATVAASGVSEAHLQALFARDVGVSMRRYRLWRRVMAGVLFLRGTDATRAAHEAGFADLAHFSRSCRAMLGYGPRQMRRSLAGQAH